MVILLIKLFVNYSNILLYTLLQLPYNFVTFILFVQINFLRVLKVD